MTCVRTPDPLDQVEPGPYADDARPDDSRWERLKAWILGAMGHDTPS